MRVISNHVVSVGMWCVTSALVAAGCSKSEEAKAPPAPETKAPAPEPSAPQPEPAPTAPAKSQTLITSLEKLPTRAAKVSDGESGSWSKVKLPKELARVTLERLAFIGAERGFASGSYETLLATADGGKKWSIVTTSRTSMRNSYSRVAFANDKVGVAVSGRTMQRTEDGGATWTPGPAGEELTWLQFQNPSHGLGLAHDRVVKTEDGGQTWKPIFMPAYSFFDELHMLADGTGWLVGQTSNKLAVWRSEDRGASWSKVLGLDEDDSRHDALGVWVLDADHVWLSGDDFLIHTAEGGKTWTRTTGLWPRRAQLHAVLFADADRGWVAGFDVEQDKSFLLSTEDGGSSWARQKLDPGSGRVLAELALQGQRVWVAGDGLFVSK